MKKKIKIEDKEFVEYISNERINNEISRIASEINRDYKDEHPVFLITLNGAIFFAVELLKKLTLETYISCIKISSYEGTSSTNKIQNLIGLKENLSQKKVVIIEDIIDTGNTYEYIYEMLKNEDVKDIRIATLTFKPDAYKKSLPVNYVGISIPNKFIVGYGLDYNGKGRNLNNIYQVTE